MPAFVITTNTDPGRFCLPDHSVSHKSLFFQCVTSSHTTKSALNPNDVALSAVRIFSIPPGPLILLAPYTMRLANQGFNLASAAIDSTSSAAWSKSAAAATISIGFLENARTQLHMRASPVVLSCPRGSVSHVLRGPLNSGLKPHNASIGAIM